MGKAGSQGLWLQGAGDPETSASTVVCRAGTWALWFTEPGLRAAVGSGALKASDLLVGRAVFPPS